MKNLIACLAFNPNNDGAILPIMESRLKDIISLCRDNPKAKLVLMGGPTFRDTSTGNQSLEMKEYIEKSAADILANTETVLTNEGTSTVRELCILREMIEQEGGETRLTIVASEFFVDRVKLYAEYIFGNLRNIDFVASEVPAEGREGFQRIEEIKLQKGHEWLDGREKGDYKKILGEQEAFEQKVIRGEIDHPISRAIKPR